jgi:hypothetical protein
MAEDMADPASKQKMLEVATNYEHLAKTRRRPEDGKSAETLKPEARCILRHVFSVPAPSE